MADNEKQSRRGVKPDFFSQMETTDLQKLEEFARSPKATVDSVHEYLLAEGFTASRSAVGRWFKRFNAEDRFRASAEIADVVFNAGREDGVNIPDAALLMLSRAVLDSTAALDPESASTKDLANLALSMQRLTLGKQRVEEVRKQMLERQAHAVEEAAKVEKANGGDGSVTQKVRELLGMK